MMNKRTFLNKNFTSEGKPRAYVQLKKIENLWFNTGTLCNLKCNDCYIESSPTNKNLQYINLKEFKFAPIVSTQKVTPPLNTISAFTTTIKNLRSKKI